MTRDTGDEQAASGPTPIEDFSSCHVGILGQLQALDELPALLGPAARARRVARETIEFFQRVVVEHHAEEERDLFPAVLASAAAGDERARVQGLVERLTHEHREVESGFALLLPELERVAKGRDADVDPTCVEALVASYRAHAQFEEREFLPLCRTVLARNGDHMAALGTALHLRHAMPEVMSRFRHRI